MAPSQASKSKGKAAPKAPKRGVLARPLDALVFLLPLIAFYQVAVWRTGDRVVAFDMLRRFLELFGEFGMWAPALAVIVILLATQAASGERWTIKPARVLWMYVEAAILAAPLLLLCRVIRLAATRNAIIEFPWFDEMALSIGAGIYEELVFRLVLITLLVIIGADLLRQPQPVVGVVAIVLSSVAFSAYHHQPFGSDPWNYTTFVFRALAGVYLALVFWFRGYGPAAGCHAAYNLAIVCLA